MGESEYPTRALRVSYDAGLTWGPARVIPLPWEEPLNTMARFSGREPAPHLGLRQSHHRLDRRRRRDVPRHPWTRHRRLDRRSQRRGASVRRRLGQALRVARLGRLLDGPQLHAVRSPEGLERRAQRLGLMAIATAGMPFVSGDAGLTWSVPGDLMAAHVTGLVASRDDSRVRIRFQRRRPPASGRPLTEVATGSAGPRRRIPSALTPWDGSSRVIPTGSSWATRARYRSRRLTMGDVPGSTNPSRACACSA